MFLRILKKDLKRKKTMNIILLLFVILCSMFAAASLNNIIAVTGGIESYFDKAGVPDVTVSMRSDEKIEAEIKSLPSVKELKAESSIMLLSPKNFTYNGKKMDNFVNPPYLLSDSNMALNYFDTDNNIIKSVPKGCFYTTTPFLKDMDITAGDHFTLEIGETKLDLEYKGRLKGALFSNDASSSPYLLLNNEDFEYINKE